MPAHRETKICRISINQNSCIKRDVTSQVNSVVKCRNTLAVAGLHTAKLPCSGRNESENVLRLHTH